MIVPGNSQNKPDLMPAPRDVRRRNIIQLLAALAIIIALNLLGSVRFARFDLTSEKRYTLTQGTRDMLRNIDDIVYFRIYLEGNLPPGFRRLRNQTREMLDEFRAYSDYIQYEFVNPARAAEGEQVQEMYNMLMRKGLQPTQVQIRADDATSQQVIFPGAMVMYRGREVPVQLLQDHMGLPAEAILNNSAQALEYNLANVIRQLTITEPPAVAFLEGHGELPPRQVADITRALREFYQVERIALDGDYDVLEPFQTLIVAKPEQEFNETSKFLIDQFVMHGGSVLWLVDPVHASMDSLLPPDYETLGMARRLNLDDMLFRYGVRLNANLVMDLQAAPIPVTTGMVGTRPQISLLPWYYFPLLNPTGNHPLVRNLNMIRSEFVSSIDTVGAPGIEKTFLLNTSPYSRVAAVPVRIGLDMLQDPVDERLFSGPPQPVAVLLEGSFESVFRNRLNPGAVMPPGMNRLDQGLPARMIVVADGDIIRNQISPDRQTLPLGFDRYTNETFGNKDFILNAVNYLTDHTGIMEARAREIRLRMLDRRMVSQNRFLIQSLNTLLPVILVVVFGVGRIWWRRRRYSR
jgi:ABC-2 type transport system permease protein